ncbi:MAG: DUF420 domain-containing protein [Candidatus Latescibacterota bacterium]|nr:DUF420 domain-containing protein [Candidatus Latescibacterota bacterium]
MTVSDLPALNASLNAISAALLLGGYLSIRRGLHDRHRRFMFGALVTSALFLTSYVIYHALAGSTPYPYYDSTRPVYFAILIPHIFLATIMGPFIFVAIRHAWNGRFDHHRRITRWVWPVWMYVSITGIIIYLMLYQREAPAPAV